MLNGQDPPIASWSNEDGWKPWATYDQRQQKMVEDARGSRFVDMALPTNVELSDLTEAIDVWLDSQGHYSWSQITHAAAVHQQGLWKQTDLSEPYILPYSSTFADTSTFCANLFQLQVLKRLLIMIKDDREWQAIVQTPTTAGSDRKPDWRRYLPSWLSSSKSEQQINRGYLRAILPPLLEQSKLEAKSSILQWLKSL